MADINYDPFNDVTNPDAAVDGINASIASLFPPSALNPFLTLDQLSATAWKLDGNLNGAEKYIGTNDNFALPFRTNNIEVARFTTDGAGLTRLYINQVTNLHGSNAGIQYATTFANRAQLRVNAYGNHTGVAGITGFKSRGATVGATQSVLAGDTLFRITAIGISGDNASLNLAALVDLKVSPGGVFPAYVATDFTIDLMNLAGVRTQKFIVTSEGLVGLGTALIPTNTLHIGGTFRYVDGNEAAGKVLTSDATGVASWQTAGGGGGGTLAATLVLGNTTGANDIIVDSGYAIASSLTGGRLDLAHGTVTGYVTISTDNGLGNDALLEVATTYSGLSNAGSPLGTPYMIGVECFSDGTRNLNNSWSTGIEAMVNIGVSPVFGAAFDDYQDISIIENSTAARSVSALGTRRAVFIATRNSTINAGITRSVIIGGNGITGTANDTVYLGNNLRVVDTTNITTLQHTSATAVTNLLPTAGNHAVLNMTGFGIGGSPTINLIGSNSGTAAINVSNGSLGVNTGAFKSWVSTAGSPYRNSAIGIQKNSTGRILLWQQFAGADITLLSNTGDDSTTINVGILVKQDTVTIQRIHNLGVPPVYTAKLNVGGSTLALSAMNIQTSALIPTAPGAGDMWYDGTDMYLDNGALTATTRQKVARVLTAQAPLNFPATGTLQSSDLTITVTGATPGDHVALGTPNGSVIANSCYTAWVSGANTVTVRFNNYSTGLLDPGNGVFRVMVFKN